MAGIKTSYTPSDITLYVPCYNAAETIEVCLDGILKQTVRPRRVLVIDDGSDLPYLNAEIEIIRHNQNKGLAAARNTALKACDTALIAALDSDVLPDPSWLETLLSAVNEHNCSGAGGMMIERYTNSVANRWRSVHMAQNWGDTLIRNPRFLFGANTLYRTQVLKNAGGYNERLRSNDEDRTMSDLLYAQGHATIYTPQAHCEHLRRDTIKTILRGYWKWHHSKGLLNGDFDSIAGITSRIEQVNFGIFTYRFHLDDDAGRSDLLPLDMMIPWVFCAMDLLMLNQHTGLGIPHFPPAELLQDMPKTISNLIKKMLPQVGSIDANELLADEYLAEFKRNIDISGWMEKIGSIQC